MGGDPRADDAAPTRAALNHAFEHVPRAGFLPAGARWRSGYDGPLDIGHGQTNSQPRTVRDMLLLLAVQPGQRVLDVGSGSGWTTALLAELVGPSGQVFGVEVEPDLVAFGSANIADVPNASITAAEPGVLGLPASAPFDRILVSASPLSLPSELVDQLADDGRMVIPVNGRMLLVVRSGDDVDVTAHGHYRFVPLR